MQNRKPVDPATADLLLAHKGGFEVAYKRLLSLAGKLLSSYAGDSASRVALRQLTAEDIVDAAFERLFGEGLSDGEDIYFVLRNHIRNDVRSKAKSKKESRLVRTDASKGLTDLYNQQSEPTETSAVDKLIILDDIEFCQKVIFRLAADGKHDPEVSKICEAIISGFRDPADLREFAGLDESKFTAAFRRLKRRFVQSMDAITKETTP
jgi:hypothetical protein